MASYQEEASVVVDTIAAEAAAGNISQATADAITQIVNELSASGAQAVIQTTTGNITSAAEVDGNIVMMGKDQKIEATFTEDAPVEAIVVGGAGNSNVVFETSKDVSVQLQGGEGDSVATGSGNDSITFAGGTATIDTGEGADEVVLQGGTGSGTAVISHSGTESMNVVIDMDINALGSDGVSASIGGGEGFDSVTFKGGRSDSFFFDFFEGVFRMVKHAFGRAADDQADVALQMTNVNVVKFTDGTDSDNNVDEVTVLASDDAQGLAARMYQIVRGEQQAVDTTTGQDGTGNVEGLQFWIDNFKGSTTEEDLDHLAMSMLKSGEFDARYGAMSNEDFVNAMFANLNAGSSAPVEAVNSMTAADIVAQLNSGAVDKYEVAIDFATSQQAVDLMGVDGNQYVIGNDAQ